MDEKEFKKLAANSRDWLIYQLLSEKSKETVVKEIKSKLQIVDGHVNFGEHVSGVNLEDKTKGETTVEETVTGKVVLVTDLAVLIGNADRVAWFPKSVIVNLDKIALKQGEIVELKIVDWFKYKIEWRVPQE